MSLREEIRQLHDELERAIATSDVDGPALNTMDRQLTEIWSALDLIATRVDALDGERSR